MLSLCTNNIKNEQNELDSEILEADCRCAAAFIR